MKNVKKINVNIHRPINFEDYTTEELTDGLSGIEKEMEESRKAQSLHRTLKDELFRRENSHFSGRYFNLNNKYRSMCMYVRKPIFWGYFDMSLISREHGSLKYYFDYDCNMLIDFSVLGRELVEISREDYIEVISSIQEKMLND